MSRKIYVDASYFIAKQILEHPFHNEATVAGEKLAGSLLFVSFLAIDEIIYGLGKYRISKKEISIAVKEDLLEIEEARFIGSPSDVEEFASYLNFWEEATLRPRDTAHLYLMKKNNIDSIITYDRDFIDNQEQLGIKIVN